MLSFRTTEEQRLIAQDRRDRLRAAGLCINGPAEGFVSRNGIVHGPVAGAGKCQRCIDFAKLSYVRAKPRYQTIRNVVEAHAALALDDPDDRERLIRALEHRPRCR